MYLTVEGAKRLVKKLLADKKVDIAIRDDQELDGLVMVWFSDRRYLEEADFPDLVGGLL